MNTPVAIIIAGIFVAAAILVTNHWQLSGTQSDAVRLDRWTGDDSCSRLVIPMSDGQRVHGAWKSGAADAATPSSSAVAHDFVLEFRLVVVLSRRGFLTPGRRFIGLRLRDETPAGAWLAYYRGLPCVAEDPPPGPAVPSCAGKQNLSTRPHRARGPRRVGGHIAVRLPKRHDPRRRRKQISSSRTCTVASRKMMAPPACADDAIIAPRVDQLNG